MNQKIVDIDGFYKDIGTDYEILKELYLLFVEEIAKEKEEVSKFFARGIFDELKKTVHNIKGMASSYRAKGILEYAKILDMKLKCQDFENMDKYIVGLNTAIDQSMDEINKFFQEKKSYS